MRALTTSNQLPALVNNRTLFERYLRIGDWLGWQLFCQYCKVIRLGGYERGVRILVIYEPGELGQRLLERLNGTGLNITPLLLSRPEEVALEQLQSWLEPHFDLVINVITLDDPETAETQPQQSRHRLYDLPVALAERAAIHAVAMLQLSSCYVFDGRKQQPYISSNPGNPLATLGQCQWDCEQFLRSRLPRHLILRSGWSLRRLIDKVRNHPSEKPLAMSGRHFGQPVPVADLVRVVAAIAQQLDCGAEAWGTYQYASADPISMCDLGLEIAALMSREQRPHVVDEDAPWLALEPVNAILNCRKIRHTFGIQQLPWCEALRESEHVTES